MRTIIAFDPGLTLGVSVFFDDILWDCYILEQKEHYHYFEYQFPKLTTGRQTVVVCEDFVGRYLSTEAKETLKLIGMIEYATRQQLGTLPVYQRAQARISFLPQAKTLVRQLPIQRKWLQHHYDSTAQALAYLYYTRNTDTAAFAPDLCLTQGEADEPPTAREA